MKTRKMMLSLLLVGLFMFTSIGAAYAQDDGQAPVTVTSEEVSPYLTLEHLTYADGTEIEGALINGPSSPPAEFEAERLASIQPEPEDGVIANFPSFSWVFGCSAVSAAMIATYYDRGSYPKMYQGPTAGGVMPLTDTSWPTWSDGYTTYPNNPLIASKLGVDGRTSKGSINDYWIKYGSTLADPYITGGWTQHAWGTAIGDYMKTSQSKYYSTDGSTWFYNYYSSAKLQCSAMPGLDSGKGTWKISDVDGTYGRKLFYQARGYTVTECYNQPTDNKYAGGFSLANFQAQINAGHPVLINLAGHSIVGYGYSGSTIYIRDTWDNNTAHTYTMPWGGSYSGMTMQSVSIVRLAAPTGGGFNSQFNGNMTGWAKKGTVAFYPSSTYMYSNGTSGKWAQAYWTGSTFSNFNYQARLRRGNGDATSANTLFVRMGSSIGTGTLGNWWYPGYFFEYTNGGSYSIWKMTSPTSYSAIQGWTSSSAIKKNDWNVLRVYANGSTFKFYINGTLVKSFTSSWRTSGYVGVGFADYGKAGDLFGVDWATLTKLSAKNVNADEVSADQEALNEAANIADPIGDVTGLFE